MSSQIAESGSRGVGPIKMRDCHVKLTKSAKIFHPCPGFVSPLTVIRKSSRRSRRKESSGSAAQGRKPSSRPAKTGHSVARLCALNRDSSVLPNWAYQGSMDSFKTRVTASRRSGLRSTYQTRPGGARSAYTQARAPITRIFCG